MTTLLPFTEVAPGRIADAFATAYAKLMASRPKASIRRAASANLISLSASSAEITAMTPLTEAFSAVHPGRLFLIGFDETLSDLKTAVSIAVHERGANDILASDLVRITMPSLKVAAVGSVVRANLLGGSPTEIWLGDIDRTLALLEPLAPLADALILDSTTCENRFAVLGEVRSLIPPGLDLSWTALAQWREQVRALFQKPIIRDRLQALKKITFTAATTHRVAASQLLLAGWIAERLGLRCSPLDSQKVRCTADGFGRPVTECLFAFQTAPQKINSATGGPPGSTHLQRSRLVDLCFEFAHAPQAPGIDRVSIACSAGSLTTTVEPSPSYKSSRPADDDSQIELIKRYYSIGDSTLNYPGALSRALELYSLLHTA